MDTEFNLQQYLESMRDEQRDDHRELKQMFEIHASHLAAHDLQLASAEARLAVIDGKIKVAVRTAVSLGAAIGGLLLDGLKHHVFGLPR